MACFHPLKAYYRLDDRGKKILKFCKDLEVQRWPQDAKLLGEPILIPCGQCIGCRLEYSRQWAVRCMLESQYYDNNLFVTLTYDDEHLPIASSPLIHPVSGEVLFENSPLVSKDLQDWLKRFRKMCSDHYDWEGVRFYACGEYGDLGRPHYHVILFNCPVFHDFMFYKKNFDGSILYNSKEIESTWQNGFVVIGEVTFNSCAYVARYMMKKHKGKDSDWYELHGITPEFCRMSRRPGIGRLYYDNHFEHIYRFDSIVITGRDGLPLSVRPPQYFDRLYDQDCPDHMSELKDKRIFVGKTNNERVLERTSLSEEQYLSVKEGNKLIQIEQLKRKFQI